MLINNKMIRKELIPNTKKSCKKLKNEPMRNTIKSAQWYTYRGLPDMDKVRYSDFFKTQSRHQTFTLHYMKDFIV